ncbi:hypothetical protein [Stigmatella erecta]|nr:hypothetical protein [Stigmatella erecta]
MLEEPLGLVRQAAVFGLETLGGAASARLLEQQLEAEEAREDLDGAAVVEDIVRALGRIEAASARASLVKRLERLVQREPELSDVNALARMLWRKRHPELIPAVRSSLARLSLPAPHGLHGLLVLLEKSPEALREWGLDPAVPAADKSRVLSLLEEELPEAWEAVLPAFLSAAQAWAEPVAPPGGEPAYFCERLLSLVLTHQERLLASAPEGVRSALRALARSLVQGASMGCALRAAAVLKLAGTPEDAALLDAHCPEDATFAQVFRNAARILREKH